MKIPTCYCRIMLTGNGKSQRNKRHVHEREVAVSRILPPKEQEGDLIPTSLRIPSVILKKLDAISKESGYIRTEVMLHFLRWAIQEYEAEAKPKK